MVKLKNEYFQISTFCILEALNILERNVEVDSSIRMRRQSRLSRKERSSALVPFISLEEREELDDISISAKEGHPAQTMYCEMCVDRHRPCWTPHRIR